MININIITHKHTHLKETEEVIRPSEYIYLYYDQIKYVNRGHGNCVLHKLFINNLLIYLVRESFLR